MKRHWFQSIAVLTSIAVLSLSAHAADNSKPRFPVKAKVSVLGSESIKSSVSSYLNRELRSLNDVELVDDDYEWEIRICAIEIKMQTGQKAGFALSSVIIQTFYNRPLSLWVKPRHLDYVLDLTSGLSYYPIQRLRVGGPEDLQEMCKDVIADFDTQRLKPRLPSQKNLSS